VKLQSEKDLENILLSAYLLRDGDENGSRVYADVPWSERKKPTPNAKQSKSETPDGRSIVILNVPEYSGDSNVRCKSKHDFEQWRYLSDIIQATNEAATDIFRIPHSLKYQGSGPRPLKVTLLTDNMADRVFDNWKQFRSTLPKEIRMIRGNIKPRPNMTQEKINTQDMCQKNDCAPTPTGSALI
jgi:hypothetical protein